MTQHLPPLSDPPTPPKGDAWIVICLVLLLAALLVDCDGRAQSIGVLPGSVTVAIVNPPVVTTCSQRGWSFEYTATNQVFRASHAVFSPSTQVLEITPALEECIYKDSFE